MPDLRRTGGSSWASKCDARVIAVVDDDDEGFRDALQLFLRTGSSAET
jgi:hypothetical protein